MLRGKVQRGGSGGEGLRGWHGAVVQEELSDLVVPVSAGVVESGTSDTSILSMLLKRGKKVEESQSFEWPGKKRGSGEEAAHPSARPRDQNPAIDLCSGRRDSPLVSEGILHGSHHLGQELLALLDVAPLGRKMKLSHVCLFFGFVRTCFCARVAGKREYDVKVSTFLEKKKKDSSGGG